MAKLMVICGKINKNTNTQIYYAARECDANLMKSTMQMNGLNVV